MMSMAAVVVITAAAVASWVNQGGVRRATLAVNDAGSGGPAVMVWRRDKVVMAIRAGQSRAVQRRRVC